jgi:SepF-like predicted cell division protein (DUF552 family)
MKKLNEDAAGYFKKLEKRSQKSRIHQSFQAIGLEIAAILGDLKHKSLYIKLAKIKDGQNLLRLAKEIAEKPYVKNRGAYFMKLLHQNGNFNRRK